MIKSAEDLSNGSGVTDHAACSHHFGKITSWYDCRGLIVDADFEASGAPVDELDGSLGLDGGDGCIDVFGDDVTTIHHGAGHVLTMTGITLSHHVGRLETTVGDLSWGELFVVGLLGGDDWGVGGEHEVDSGVGDQVGLEFGDVHVQGAVETKGSGEGGDDLGDETVEVGVGWTLDIQVSSADIIDGFIIKHDSNIGMFKQRMRGKDGVIWFYDSIRDLW